MSDELLGALAPTTEASAAPSGVIASLEASLETLHGAKFSDRSYHALKSRAEKAEARADRLAEALKRIADQGPNYGPDGTRESWMHWSEIARAALGAANEQPVADGEWYVRIAGVHQWSDYRETCGVCGSRDFGSACYSFRKATPPRHPAEEPK